MGLEPATSGVTGRRANRTLVRQPRHPTHIVEVLSRSTEEYDSRDKFEHYKTFPSLREYVLVSHRERSVEVRSRGEDGWRTTVVSEGAIAELSIGARLDVRELYDAAAEPSA